MSSIHRSTPIMLPRLADAKLFLSKADSDLQILTVFYAGSRHEPAVAFVADLTAAAVELVRDTTEGHPCSPRLTETAMDLARRFARLSLSRRRHAIDLLMTLLSPGPPASRGGGLRVYNRRFGKGRNG